MDEQTKMAVKLGAICLSSFIVMIEAARVCDRSGSCTGYHGWAVACSVISTAFTGGLVAAWRLNFLPAPELPVPNGNIVTVVALTVWWGLGAGMMTFESPFRNQPPGNGYFCTWICFLLSSYMATKLISQMGQMVDTIHNAGADTANIFFASCVLALQSMLDCGNDCSGELIWAIVASLVSVVVTVIAILFRSQIPQLPFAAGLCLLWLAAWAVLTIKGPYEAVGNGYFAVSVAFFLSVKMLMVVLDVFKYVEGAGLPYTQPGADAAPPVPQHDQDLGGVPPIVSYGQQGNTTTTTTTAEVMKPPPPPPAGGGGASDAPSGSYQAPSAPPQSAEHIFWQKMNHQEPEETA